MTFDEIATRQNMSLVQVGNAIQRMEDHSALNSQDMVDLALNEAVLKSMSGVDKVLAGGMKAVIEGSERRGKVGEEKWVKTSRPDHATRIKTLETIKGFVESTRPKGGGVNIALQQNNAGGGGGDIRPQGHSFEERLRKIREAKGLTNNDVVVEAEFMDPPTLADELADIGIDLEDEDDDDEVEGEEEYEDGEDTDDGAGTP